jgi:hypothetical protein
MWWRAKPAAYKNLKAYFDQIINIMENLNAKNF